ncbi:MAG: alpha-amylase family glycosyl hydrolase [Bryobacter sp.]|nr:alpha-amylase family glycosyl hydrolase [Bryobacter sp.]
MIDRLELLYGPERAAQVYPEVERILQVHYAHKPLELIEQEKQFRPEDRFTEKDVVAITYGDLIQSPNKPPLDTLASVVDAYLRGTVNTLHILPFFPHSSDRGFSIVHYREVDPQLGNWQDIEDLSGRFQLMFDGVINHVSAKSEWFQEFLNGNPYYQDFFITFDTEDAIAEADLRQILRPRTTKLLTRFRTLRGDKYVWTTFSADQIDLNYANERVLLEVLQVLLFYVRRGADILRLDAATYLWHRLGTSCAHLAETHALVQFFRAAINVAAPRVALVTETNVPHRDNVSYFGDGSNEAHMVYNFALPPLVLRAMRTGNCSRLTEWASQLQTPSPTTTFFNFLDSHDGIGLLGARAYLSDMDIEDMVRRTLAHRGKVSYRTAPDGTLSPYELNITWFDALNRPGSDEPVELQVARFVASRSIALALAGVPGIYLPSFGGSRFESEELPPDAEPRSINRRTIQETDFLRALNERGSVANLIARRMMRLIRRRIHAPAFHPNGEQTVLNNSTKVFAVRRRAPDGGQVVIALTNVTAETQKYRLNPEDLLLCMNSWQDLLTGRRFPCHAEGGEITLKPYQVMWITPAD